MGLKALAYVVRLPQSANGNIAAAMILACSSCQARYLVPATHFASGARTVRCARCGHTWSAEAPAEPAVALAEQLSALSPPVGETVPSAPAIPSQLPIVQDETKSFWLRDWVLATLAVILAAFLLVLVIDRRDIASRWPSMEQYYDRIGLHIYHSGEGLILRDVRSEMRFEGGITKLEVEGEVFNNTREPRPIPNILAAAIGPDTKTMQSWQIDAPAATVAPGETVPFSSAINAPEGTVTQIHLHFIEPNDAQ
jgi:predicted Zn finger-like uncharacterized protein